MAGGRATQTAIAAGRDSDQVVALVLYTVAFILQLRCRSCGCAVELPAALGSIRAHILPTICRKLQVSAGTSSHVFMQVTAVCVTLTKCCWRPLDFWSSGRLEVDLGEWVASKQIF